MTHRGPEPRLDRVPPEVVQRVRVTVSCTDADQIPKVDGAGSTVVRDGVPVQLMHNGIVVEEGCYFGPWMTEIIRSLRGHHEPQEELAFDSVVNRLGATPQPPVMIEFGSFWAYYSLWFAHDFPGAQVVAMEPDPANLRIGVRNAELNGLQDRVRFVHGAVGAQPGEVLEFVAESDGRAHHVVQHDLHSLMAAAEVEYADVVLADIQGAETVLLARARADLLRGRVRFLIVSTHHYLISGSPTTHQDALEMLRGLGAHIIAEHTVAESYSGDGLIVASFDDRDKDFVLELSYARAKDSLFGELEPALADALRRGQDAERLAEQLRDELQAARADRDLARLELASAPDPARALRRPQRVYDRLRRHG